MDRLEELKSKYKSVLDYIAGHNVRLDHVHIQDNKLYVSGAAPNQDVKNAVWNQIKAVDPSYSDLTCDLSIDSSLPAPAAANAAPAGGGMREYTVQPGDSLWKIAQHMLGGGAHYPKIIAANPGKLKDENSVIHPGDVLHIPAE